MKTEKILIVGASGTVGSEVVRLLRNECYEVSATTQKPVESGDRSKVHVNLATGEGLGAAFEGIDRAFLLSPPGYADQYGILSPLIQEAKRWGLKKVVLMTAMGANAVETSPFRKAEIELEKSGLPYNIIRPNWFFQNFNTFWVQGIRELGKIQLPAGFAQVSFIDARDVSAVAAKLLATDDSENEAFDLSGPEAIDHNDVAKAISLATGRKVEYQDIAPETLKQGLVAAGLPVDYVNFMILIFGFLREGYNAGVNSNVRKILGRDAHGLKKYIQDYQASWVIT